MLNSEIGTLRRMPRSTKFWSLHDYHSVHERTPTWTKCSKTGSASIRWWRRNMGPRKINFHQLLLILNERKKITQKFRWKFSKSILLFCFHFPVQYANLWSTKICPKCTCLTCSEAATAGWTSQICWQRTQAIERSSQCPKSQLMRRKLSSDWAKKRHEAYRNVSTIFKTIHTKNVIFHITFENKNIRNSLYLFKKKCSFSKFVIPQYFFFPSKFTFVRFQITYFTV